MAVFTIEVTIKDGAVVVPSSERLPTTGRALLTVLDQGPVARGGRGRARLPLIPGTPGHMVNPTKAELEASLWNDAQAG